ncbi:polyamine aminopropyltransferase [Streptomyces decoyicus]|uniref:polyamine aminopropyltransferase n=1 Tax=Streptomyces decoyicus TaxID=249567 RepID=UPI00069EA9EE|nr:polyamine aminopropyltransferase [Streptomyces decoyicus]KOG39275.1 spermidine synthase [Streptomyces decoyicus]QZY16885.1 polyamine aminopropyltransferase [Streptomyces decoyicus]
MIDPPEPVLPGAPGVSEAMTPVRLPVPAGPGRLLVLAVVFVCAACGLVYELELVALATYLVGDSVTQASVVLSVMVFAMGVGALLAKRLRCRAAVGFGAIEAALALVGGCSAMALYACFAWFGQSRSALVGFSLAIGILIGAEVPLLMTLIQRVRRQDAGGAVADLFAADYVGALVGGLAFPFLLLPSFGQLTGALLTGGVNAVAGSVLVLWLFRRDLSGRARWALFAANALVLALLAAGMMLAAPFERAARQAVYGSSARVAVQTGIQEVVMTGGTGAGAGAGRGRKGSGGPLALYLDGRLRVSAETEFRYHEALVHPAMAGGPHRRVLVLGGGDGLAVREILHHRSVRSVTVVELDPGVLKLARTDPGLSRLNHRSLGDPRVHVVTADAFDWLRQQGLRGRRQAPYDVIVSDLPDPGIAASTKLYSQEFYGLAARLLAPDGRLVVHAGPPVERSRLYWTVESTLRSVGLATVPYRLSGRPAGFSGGPDRTVDAAPPVAAEVPAARPSAGRDRYWGFVLAARHRPRFGLAPDAPPPAGLSRAELQAGRRGEARDRMPGLPASTLMHPRYLD